MRSRPSTHKAWQASRFSSSHEAVRLSPPLVISDSYRCALLNGMVKSLASQPHFDRQFGGDLAHELLLYSARPGVMGRSSDVTSPG
jgi:hypothetical protein